MSPASDDQHQCLACDFFYAVAAITLTVTFGKLITDYYFAILIVAIAAAIAAIEVTHQVRVSNRMMVTNTIERHSMHQHQLSQGDGTWSANDRRKTVKIVHKPKAVTLDEHRASPSVNMMETVNTTSTPGRDDHDNNQPDVKPGLHRRLHARSSSERVLTLTGARKSSEKKSHTTSPFKRFSLKRNKDRSSMNEKQTSKEKHADVRTDTTTVTAT